MSLSLEIGKPVYILSKAEGKIIPGIVFEQKMVLGSKTPVWTIMLGPLESRKLIPTDKLGESFEVITNLYDLREALFKQAMISVNSSVKEALENMKNWYLEEVGEELLKSALTLEKPKGIGGAVDAKNMSFKDLVGENKLQGLKEEAKKRGRKKKESVSPTPQNEESFEEEEAVEEQQVKTNSIPLDEYGDPKIKLVDENGKVTYLSREEFENTLE